MGRVDHPLIEHHLCTIRDASTPAATFRDAVANLTILVGTHATAHLPTQPHTVTTPLCPCTGRRVVASVALVPILRAGLGMVAPMQQLMPEASVWHLGMYRDEQTAKPVGYYDKLPDGGATDVAFVLDPMVATGGSIAMAIDRLRDWGVQRINVVGLIASRDGIDRLADQYPDVDVHVAAIDPELNDRAFIVPGLGDAGDRIFDTPAAD